ncbi:hypothetical protein DXG01_004555 [Tephrocybe rancida]|nr:hypothetical protein DXG01_004555 [Tephrocybe rancida]
MCVLKSMKKAQDERTKQKKLGFNPVKPPVIFMRERVLENIAKHTAIDNQALMLADKITFHNCLTAMRPQTKLIDLTTAHDASVYLHNAFVSEMNKLKAAIKCSPGKVSATADGWTTDTTKMGYLGVTAHWIKVNNSGKWTLHSKLPCLEHVTNLMTVDVMGHIMKIKAIDTTSAIWDYSLGDNVNCVLDGQIDVITTIRTLAIKLQSSGQHIQYFESLQLECGYQTTLKLTLHNNTQWGSAFIMLECALKLQSDSNCVLHYFSSEKQPTLWRALPALESLQTEWEDKLFKHQWALFHAAIHAGLAKLIKYYMKFDHKPVYILALFLHPYFKLHYIQTVWDGPEEQKAEFNKGNFDAKGWVDEAWKFVKNMMEKYWSTWPMPTATNMAEPSTSQANDNNSFTSEFNRHHCMLITQNHNHEWQAELHRYLMSVPANVNADMDILEWWTTTKYTQL